MLPWIIIGLACAAAIGLLMFVVETIGTAMDMIEPEIRGAASFVGVILIVLSTFFLGHALVNRNTVHPELFTVTSVTTTAVKRADGTIGPQERMAQLTSSWRNPEADNPCGFKGVDCSTLDIGDTVVIEHVYGDTGNWGAFDRVGAITRKSS